MAATKNKKTSSSSSYRPQEGGTVEALDAVLTKENAHHVGEFIAGQINEVALLATDGTQSLRNLAVLGGFAMVLTSALGMIGKALRFNCFGSLMSFYTTVLGCVIIGLETNQSFEWVDQYVLFLKFVWGRGYMYFIAGSLQASQLNLADSLVGFWMMLVGIMYVITSQKTSRKLTELRTKLVSEEVLMHQFYQFDNDEDGTLNPEAFQNFMTSLGLSSLDQNELDVAFTMIDQDQDSKINFNEFYQWWSTWSLSPEQLHWNWNSSNNTNTNINLYNAPSQQQPQPQQQSSSSNYSMMA